jgi:hypothetical protein
MYAETYRPTNLDDVIGHSDAKESLRTYLTSKSFSRAVMLSGPPGIGKTTLALAAAKTFGFDPLEINASRCIRSFEDVHKIKDACRSAVNIQSFLCGERNRKTCVILDEVDGSDPHAQTKIVEWIRDQTRKVPIICTGNELPTIFKRNSESIDLIRCFPPKATELETVFPDQNIHLLTRECNYDIRRMLHRVQYGESYMLPKYISPPTGLPIEQMFLMKQKMFGLPELLAEYRVCIPDTELTSKANSRYRNGGKHAHTDESGKQRKKASPGKLRKRK